jgi:hypothetical protein
VTCNLNGTKIIAAMERLPLSDLYQTVTGKPMKKLTEAEMMLALMNIFEKNQQCESYLTRLDSDLLQGTNVNCFDLSNQQTNLFYVQLVILQYAKAVRCGAIRTILLK